MLNETYYTNGKNEFKNNIFDANEWSAPYMVSVKEIKKTINEIKLIGREIKDIRFISQVYNLNRFWVEEYAYNQIGGLPEKERHINSEYAHIDSNMMYLRYAQIDAPLLILFEDNDCFEIDTPQDPEYRISMNCIPFYINDNVHDTNVDAAKLFDICLKKKIIDVEVTTKKIKKDPMFSDEFADGNEREIVSAVILWLEGDIGICITPQVDYCLVYVINKKKEIVKLPFSQLKAALCNWEDIHDDEDINFHSNCRSFWFGEQGRYMVGNPYNTIMPVSREHSLRINEDDSALLDFAVSAVIGEQHDIYEDYEFSYEEWNQVLDECDKIMSFSTFDEVFDYLVGLRDKTSGICDLLYYLNNCGEEFWDRKTLHYNEAKDIRRWTELVRKPGEKMLIIGF